MVDTEFGLSCTIWKTLGNPECFSFLFRVSKWYNDAVEKIKLTFSDTRHLALKIVAVIFAFIPLIFVPRKFDLLSDSKFFILGFGLSIVLLLLSMFALQKKEEVSIPLSIGTFSLFLLPFIYLVSSFRSIEPIASFVGGSAERVTTFSLSLWAIVFFAVFTLFKSKRDIYILLTFLVSTCFLAVLFEFFKIFFPRLTTLYTFFGSGENLVGSWSEIGILSFLLVGIFYILLSRVRFSFLGNFFLYAGLIVCYFVGLLSHVSSDLMSIHAPLYIVLPIFFILVEGIRILYLSIQKKKEAFVSHIQNAFPALLLALLCAVSLLFSKQIQSFFEERFIVVPESSHLSATLTSGVFLKSITVRPFFGFGPGTFPILQDGFRSVSENLSPFYATTFEIGSSGFLTEAASVGMVASFMWVLFLGSVFLLSLIALFGKPKEHSVKRTIIAFSSGFLVLVFCFLETGFLSLFLLFVFAGLLYGEREREGKIAKKVFREKGAVILLLFFVLLFLKTAFISLYVFAEKVFVSHGESLLEKNKIEDAYSFLKGVSKISMEKQIHILAAKAGVLLMDAEIYGKGGNANGEKLASLLQDVVKEIDTAEKLSPLNLKTKLFAAEIYGKLGEYGIDENFEAALQKLSEAKKLSVANPVPYLFEAKIYARLGETQKAKEALSESIRLKPNYTESYLFLATLTDGEGLVEATKLLISQADMINTFDKDLLFQRGIIKLGSKDYKGALIDFREVIEFDKANIQPRYFEALALYLSGEKEEGIKKMKRLRGLSRSGDRIEQTLRQMKEGSLKESQAVVE